jgi:hypothetical protein
MTPFGAAGFDAGPPGVRYLFGSALNFAWHLALQNE